MSLAGSSPTSTAASVGGAPWDCVKFDTSWARSAISCSAVAVPEIMLAIDQSRNTTVLRSEEHTSELQSLMRISYAVFCLKKKNKTKNMKNNLNTSQR